MDISEFAQGEQYHRNLIDSAKSKEVVIKEVGIQNCVGEEFIVLQEDGHYVVSFVLIGHGDSSQRNLYECIYTSF